MEIVRFLDLINRRDQVSLAYIQQYLALNSHTFASYFCREAFIESVEFKDEKENKESEWGVREGDTQGRRCSSCFTECENYCFRTFRMSRERE